MTDIAIALAAVRALLQNAAPILGVLQNANAQGRTTLTDDEWAQVRSAADAAHANLEAALQDSPAGPPAPPVTKPGGTP